MSRICIDIVISSTARLRQSSDQSPDDPAIREIAFELPRGFGQLTYPGRPGQRQRQVRYQLVARHARTKLPKTVSKISRSNKFVRIQFEKRRKPISEES